MTGVENPFSSEEEYESAIRKLEEFMNSENHNQWLVLTAIFFHLPKHLRAFVKEDLQAFQSFLIRMAVNNNFYFLCFNFPRPSRLHSFPLLLFHYLYSNLQVNSYHL